MFVNQLIIGALLVCLTVFIHAITLDRLMKFVEKIGPQLYKRLRSVWKPSLLMMTVLGIFCAHIVQIWLWAGFYMAINAFSDFETALYFSTSSFTTVGYGDVYLGKDWRLLSSFQSANGFILFGWSTAFIFEIMSMLYKNDAIKKMEKSR